MGYIFEKEMRSYFNSLTGYMFMFVFLLISGLFFTLSNIVIQNGDCTSTIYSLIFLFMFLMPILTMKILSSEMHEKTDQLLLTSPLKVWEIVLGKFFAASVLFLIGIVITMLYPFILSRFGKIPTARIISSYFGFALIGMSFISVGIFISSLTDNGVTAALGSFGAVFLIWILDWITGSVPTSIISGIVFLAIIIFLICYFLYNNTKSLKVTSLIAGISALVVLGIYLKDKTLFEGFIVKCFKALSLIQRFEPFNMGILSLSSIVYYITFIAVFLFLTIQRINKRRWN